MQALAGRQHAGGEVGGQAAGAGFARQVALALVVVDLLVGEGLQSLVGVLFTSRPELTQAGSRRGEARHRVDNGVTGDRQRRLRGRAPDQRGQGAVQALVADLAELAVDLEVAAGLGQHAAGAEQ
ncbi:hypothetical protein D9M69_678610 [compost metagenome]